MPIKLAISANFIRVLYRDGLIFLSRGRWGIPWLGQVAHSHLEVLQVSREKRSPDLSERVKYKAQSC